MSHAYQWPKRESHRRSNNNLFTHHLSSHSVGDVQEVLLHVKDFTQFGYDERVAWCLQQPEDLQNSDESSINTNTKGVEILHVSYASPSTVAPPQANLLRTQMSAIYSGYRVVIVVDASPAMAVVDQHSGDVLLDRAHQALETILRVLAHPLKLPMDGRSMDSMDLNTAHELGTPFPNTPTSVHMGAGSPSRHYTSTSPPMMTGMAGIPHQPMMPSSSSVSSFSSISSYPSTPTHMPLPMQDRTGPPNIFVSVVAYCGPSHPQLECLCQNVTLTGQNVNEVIQDVTKKLREVENKVCELNRHCPHNRRDRRNINSMFRCKNWAEFLPSRACPLLFVITDFHRDTGMHNDLNRVIRDLCDTETAAFLTNIASSPSAFSPSTDPHLEPFIKLVGSVTGSYFVDWSFLKAGLRGEPLTRMSPEDMDGIDALRKHYHPPTENKPAFLHSSHELKLIQKAIFQRPVTIASPISSSSPSTKRRIHAWTLSNITDVLWLMSLRLREGFRVASVQQAKYESENAQLTGDQVVQIKNELVSLELDLWGCSENIKIYYTCESKPDAGIKVSVSVNCSHRWMENLQEAQKQRPTAAQASPLSEHIPREHIRVLNLVDAIDAKDKLLDTITEVAQHCYEHDLATQEFTQPPPSLQNQLLIIKALNSKHNTLDGSTLEWRGVSYQQSISVIVTDGNREAMVNQAWKPIAWESGDYYSTNRGSKDARRRKRVPAFSSCMQQLFQSCQQWAWKMVDDHVYVKIFRPHVFRRSFCILNVLVRTHSELSQACVAELRLSFFNVPAHVRKYELRDLQVKIDKLQLKFQGQIVGLRKARALLSPTIKSLLIQPDGEEEHSDYSSSSDGSSSSSSSAPKQCPSNNPDKPHFEHWCHLHHASSYFVHKRWLWRIGNANLRTEIARTIVHQRLREGVHIARLAERNLLFVKSFHIFLHHKKMAPLRRKHAHSLSPDPPLEERAPCWLFYRIQQTPIGLRTDVWLEPQNGYLLRPGSHHQNTDLVQKEVIQVLEGIDSTVMSAFATFGTVCLSGPWSWERSKEKAMPENFPNVRGTTPAQVPYSNSAPVVSAEYPPKPQVLVQPTMKAIPRPERLEAKCQDILLDVELLFKQSLEFKATFVHFTTAPVDTPPNLQARSEELIAAENEGLYRRLFHFVSSLSDVVIKTDPTKIRADQSHLTSLLPWVREHKDDSQLEISTFAQPAGEIAPESVILTTMVHPDTMQAAAGCSPDTTPAYYAIVHECSISSLSSVSYDCDLKGLPWTPPETEEKPRDGAGARASAMGLTERTADYVQFLTDIQASSYAYGLHKVLQSGVQVNLCDISQAMQALMDYSMEIDITELLETDNFTGLQEVHSKFNSYFQSLLKSWFEWLHGTECHYFLKNQGRKHRKQRQGKADNRRDGYTSDAKRPSETDSHTECSSSSRNPKAASAALDSGDEDASDISDSSVPSVPSQHANLDRGALAKIKDKEGESEPTLHDSSIPPSKLTGESYSDNISDDVTSQASSYAPEYRQETGSDLPFFLRMETVYIQEKKSTYYTHRGYYTAHATTAKPPTQVVVVPITHQDRKPTKPIPVAASNPSKQTEAAADIGNASPPAGVTMLKHTGLSVSATLDAKDSPPSPDSNSRASQGFGFASTPMAAAPTTLPPALGDELKHHRNFKPLKASLRLVISTIPQRMFEISKGNFRSTAEVLRRKLEEHNGNEISNRSRFHPQAVDYYTQQLFRGPIEDYSDIYLPFYSLPHTVAKVGDKCKRVIQALVSRKVLQSLLRNCSPAQELERVQSLSVSMEPQYPIAKIMKHIRSLASWEYDEMSIPLEFADKEKGMKLFPAELVNSPTLSVVEGATKEGATWFVIRSIRGNDANLSPTKDDFPASQTSSSCSTPTAGLKPKDNTSPGMEPFVTSPLEPMSLSGRESLDYWMILTFESSALKITLYCPARPDKADRKGLLNAATTAIQSVCKRVNQLILLTRLHETHTADDAMIPTEWQKTDVGAACSSPTHGTRVKFKPGELECDLVQSVRINLLARVDPNYLVSHIMTTAFDPFLINNRINTCVYCAPATQAIYYLHLSKQQSKGAEPPETPDADAKDGSSEMGKREESGPADTCGAELVLDMYGVIKPDPIVVQEIETMLVNKAQQATLYCIGEHAHRNGGKISTADVNWIRSKGVAAVQTFILPSWVPTGPFYQYLKENLSLFTAAVPRSEPTPDVSRPPTPATTFEAPNEPCPQVVEPPLRSSVVDLAACAIIAAAIAASMGNEPIRRLAAPGGRPTNLRVSTGMQGTHTHSASPLWKPVSPEYSRPAEARDYEMEFFYNNVMSIRARDQAFVRADSSRPPLLHQRHINVGTAMSGKGLATIALQLLDRHRNPANLSTTVLSDPPKNPNDWRVPHFIDFCGETDEDDDDEDLWTNWEEGFFNKARYVSAVADDAESVKSVSEPELERTLMTMHEKDHLITVEVCMAGEINLRDDLLQKIAESVNQTILDCLCEFHLANGIDFKALDNFTNPMRQIAAKAAEVQSPSMLTINEEVDLPQWAIMDFLADLLFCLQAIQRGLCPITLTNVLDMDDDEDSDEEETMAVSFTPASTSSSISSFKDLIENNPRRRGSLGAESVISSRCQNATPCYPGSVKSTEEWMKGQGPYRPVHFTSDEYQYIQNLVGIDKASFCVIGCSSRPPFEAHSAIHLQQMKDLNKYAWGKAGPARPPEHSRGNAAPAPQPQADRVEPWKQLFPSPERKSLLLVKVRFNSLELISYNWREEKLRDLLPMLGKLANKAATRGLLLQSSLHQKMGLLFRETSVASPFHHQPRDAKQDSTAAHTLVEQWHERPLDIKFDSNGDISQLGEHFERSGRMNPQGLITKSTPVQSVPQLPIAQVVLAKRRQAMHRPVPKPVARAPTSKPFGLLFSNIFWNEKILNRPGDKRVERGQWTMPIEAKQKPAMDKEKEKEKEKEESVLRMPIANNVSQGHSPTASLDSIQHQPSVDSTISRDTAETPPVGIPHVASASAFTSLLEDSMGEASKKPIPRVASVVDRLSGLIGSDSTFRDRSRTGTPGAMEVDASAEPKDTFVPIDESMTSPLAPEDRQHAVMKESRKASKTVPSLSNSNTASSLATSNKSMTMNMSSPLGQSDLTSKHVNPILLNPPSSKDSSPRSSVAYGERIPINTSGHETPLTFEECKPKPYNPPGTPEQGIQHTWSGFVDPVKEHASSLVIMYVRNKENRQRRLKRLNSILGTQEEMERSRKSTQPSKEQHMGTEIWQYIKNAHVFQKFFSPLVFTEFKDIVYEENVKCIDDIELTGEEKLDFEMHHQILQDTINHTVKYIQNADPTFVAHELKVDALNEGQEQWMTRKRAVVKLRSTGNTVALKPTVVLLSKATSSSVVTFEIGHQDVNFFMNIYVHAADISKDTQGKSRPHVTSAEVAHPILDEVCNLRNRLHINALLYDFHLQKIHEFIVRREYELHRSKFLKIPDILRDISRLNTQAPSCSHNRLHEKRENVILYSTDLEGEIIDLDDAPGSPEIDGGIVSRGASLNRVMEDVPASPDSSKASPTPAQQDKILNEVFRNAAKLDMMATQIQGAAGPEFIRTVLVSGIGPTDCECPCTGCGGITTKNGTVYKFLDGKVTCLGVSSSGSVAPTLTPTLEGGYTITVPMKVYTICMEGRNLEFPLVQSPSKHVISDYKPKRHLMNGLPPHFPQHLQTTFALAAKMYRLDHRWQELWDQTITQQHMKDLLQLAVTAPISSVDPTCTPTFLSQFTGHHGLFAQLLLLHMNNHPGRSCVYFNFGTPPKDEHHYIIRCPSSELLLDIISRPEPASTNLADTFSMIFIRKALNFGRPGLTLTDAEMEWLKFIILDMSYSLWESV